MSAVEFQTAFAKMVTDEQFRNAVQRGDDWPLQGLTLDAIERRSLLEGDASRFAEFADMVAAAHLDCALGVLPLTRLMLPADFVQRIAREYVMIAVAPGPRGSAAVQEVRRFRSLVEQRQGAGMFTHPLLPDVLRFEATTFLMGCDISLRSESRRQRSVRPRHIGEAKPKLCAGVAMAHFDHDIIRVVASLRRGVLPAMEKCSCLVAFAAPSRGHAARALRIGGGAAALLALCDGSLTVDQLADVVSGADGESSYTAIVRVQVRRSVEDMAEFGIVEFSA